MIITCNKCSTSFNLDDFLIKEDGSKCRCSVCKHIFTVYPLPLETEDSGLSMEDSDLIMEDTGLDPETSDLEVDDDFSFEESEFEIDEDDEPQDLELEDGLELEDSGEEDFDGIEFEPVEDDPGSFDIEDSGPGLEMGAATDFQDMDSPAKDNSLEEEASEEEEEFELEFDIEEDSENEIPLEIETEPDKEDAVLSAEESKPEEEQEPPVITPEDDFSEYDDVLEQETEPEDDSLDEETIEIDDTRKEEKSPAEKPQPIIDPAPVSRRRRKKKPLVGAPVLVILLAFLLVIGAYIASLITGYKIPYISDIKIPFIEQYLKKSTSETSDIKPVPNQKSVNGRFVTNSTAGTLFVITGRVETPSNIALSHNEIRGAMITKGKMEAKTKNAFCGNIITEEMLKTGNISDINKLLAVKEGNHQLNVNIKPGASIPFMVVFSDLPEKLQNFTVKVIKFEKAKKP